MQMAATTSGLLGASAAGRIPVAAFGQWSGVDENATDGESFATQMSQRMSRDDEAITTGKVVCNQSTSETVAKYAAKNLADGSAAMNSLMIKTTRLLVTTQVAKTKSGAEYNANKTTSKAKSGTSSAADLAGVDASAEKMQSTVTAVSAQVAIPTEKPVMALAAGASGRSVLQASAKSLEHGAAEAGSTQAIGQVVEDAAISHQNVANAKDVQGELNSGQSNVVFENAIVDEQGAEKKSATDTGAIADRVEGIALDGVKLPVANALHGAKSKELQGRTHAARRDDASITATVVPTSTVAKVAAVTAGESAAHSNAHAGGTAGTVAASIVNANVDVNHSAFSTGHSGDGAAAKVGEAFGRLDAASGNATAMVIAASDRQVEVAVENAAHGVVNVKAELVAGGIQATLTAQSSQASDALRATLPAMSAYLESERVQVGGLTVHSGGSTEMHLGNGASGESDGQSGTAYEKSPMGSGMQRATPIRSVIHATEIDSSDRVAMYGMGAKINVVA